MEAVQLKIQSDSIHVYKRVEAWRKREQSWCIWSFIIGYLLCSVFIYYLIVSSIEYSREHRTVILTVTVVCRVFKLVLEAWVITKFIRVFQYFVKKKT